MPSDAASALRDIERHIHLATQFAASVDYETFRDDTRTVYAVCLEKHGGAGNVYRHDYEDVVAKLIWDTVQLALPPFRDVVVREIAALE